MNYAALQQKVDRVLSMMFAWINFIPEFVSTTAKDVTITFTDENGNPVTRTHPNLKKMLTNIHTDRLTVGSNGTEGVYGDNSILLYSQRGTENEKKMQLNQYDEGYGFILQMLDEDNSPTGKSLFYRTELDKWTLGGKEVLVGDYMTATPTMAGGVDGQLYAMKIGHILMLKFSGIDRNGNSTICTLPDGFRPRANTYNSLDGKTVEISAGGVVSVSSDGAIWETLTLLGATA